MEQELILLGLLQENPKHGYQIKKEIKDILALFAGVDLKSIYYPLRVLEEKGLVIKHTDKYGHRPQRFIYTLTPKGQERFQELLTKSLLNFKRPQFSLDLSLYFLRFLKVAIAKRRLRARVLILKKLAQDIAQTSASFKGKKYSLSRILEHNLAMVRSEYSFLSGLLNKL